MHAIGVDLGGRRIIKKKNSFTGDVIAEYTMLL